MTLPSALQALTVAQTTQVAAVLQLLRAGKSGDALVISRRLASEAARSPDAQQLLAMCYAEIGDVGQADSAFRSALELAPDNLLLLVNYGTMLRKFGRAEEALNVFQRAAGVAPDSAQAWLEVGITALQAGRNPLSLSALGRAVELQPDSALAWHALGNARRADGQVEGAESAFDKAISIAPEYGSAWVNLGAVRRLLGRSDQAIACFERAGKLSYASPELCDVHAGALLDVGRLEEALEMARRLTREYPDFAPGHVTLAHLLWEYGPAVGDESAIAGFRAAVQSRPNNHALRLAFASFLLSAGQAEDALHEIRTLQLTAPQATLLSFEANALDLLGRVDQAGVVYEQLHRTVGQGDPALLNTYARHLLKAGKYDAAAERCLEATRIDPANQQAWAYLATAWRLLDDPREFWLCDYERLIGLVGIEPPPGFGGQEDFLNTLKSTLEGLHRARREPLHQSLRGGSQTPGRLFGRSDPVIAAARSSLLSAVERWVATLPADPNHPFLVRKARGLQVSGSWSVKLWSSGSHVNHIHSEGWMSSAFYVSLPPSIGAQDAAGPGAGYIQFGQPPVELGLDLPPRRVIRPEPGRLALFPSYMWHGTVPFEDDQPRITIAFDIVPSSA